MEQWIDIKNYEGLYSVSDLGRIWSVRNGVLSNKSSWYNRVNLCKDGQRVTTSVHVLVAEHFIPNPESKPEVNHKWGNKRDNRAIALEWATKSENAIHAIRVLGKVTDQQDSRKIKFVGMKDGKQVSCVGIRKTARILKIPYQAIQRCLQNEKYSYLGWRFELFKDKIIESERKKIPQCFL